MAKPRVLIAAWLPDHFGIRQLLTLRDQDLALHDVDAGDHFGHGVLDLDAGIDLDEIELSGVAVDQELYRPRVLIPHRVTDIVPPGRSAAQLGRQLQGRRQFDYFLMPPLQRAIALEQVYQVAMLIAPKSAPQYVQRRMEIRSTNAGRPNAAPASRWASASLSGSSSAGMTQRTIRAAAEAGFDDDREPQFFRD